MKIEGFGIVWIFYVLSTLAIFFIGRMIVGSEIAAYACLLWQAPGIMLGVKISQEIDERRARSEENSR